MIIKKATREDLGAIQVLMHKYAKMSVSPDLFNKTDVALQARAESGELIGFLWCGIMAKGTIGYVDKFVVDPMYTRQKVGMLLGRELLSICNKRKIRNLFGVIRRDEFHDKSAFNALRGGAGGHDLAYTMVECDVQNSIEEIKSLRS